MRMERMEDNKFVWLPSGPIFYDPYIFSTSGLWIPKSHGGRSTAKEWKGNGGTLNNSEQDETLTNRRYKTVNRECNRES
jgi:hypothetical protein